MRSLSFRFALLTVFIGCCIFCLAFYSKGFLHPNQYLFSTCGDGISSYYNSYYHIVYDKSYLHFEGMNYPFSEHITYSVNNPLLTNIIKFLNSCFPGLSDYTVGILNLSMLLSFLITSLFLFFIFEEFKVNRLLAVLSSLGIMALSPQVFRMLGHLSLAYSFPIPMFIWFLIKIYRNSNKYLWLALLFFSLILLIFVHPYYASILSAFILSFTIFLFFMDKKALKKRIFSFILLFIIAILPIIGYKFFLILTDHHCCRTNNPYGFLSFTSGLNMIFIPHHPPFKPLLNKIVLINQEWEGWAYIGLSSVLVLLISGIYLIGTRRIKRIEFSKNILFENRLMNIFLLSAHVVVLFSMGMPFKIVPGYLPDLLSFLKEFRALGRFAWIYYFVITIYCTFIIQKYLEKQKTAKNKKLSYVAAIVFIILFFVEAFPYHKEVGKSILSAPNYFLKNDTLGIDRSINDIDLSRYQAVLTIPFYHSGSENFTKSPTDKILLYSELLSFKSGLPLISSYLGRTSIAESKAIMQIISPSYIEKPVRYQFPNRKPFLILSSKESLSENETCLVRRASILHEYPNFVLYQIEFDSLFYMPNLPEKENLNLFLRESFDSKTNTITYKGNGALSGKLNDFNIIYKFNPDSFIPGKNYLISFWMYNCGMNCGQDCLNSMVFVEYENSADEKEWLSVVNPSNSETIDNCWSKVILKLRLDPNKSKTSKLNLVILGNNRAKNKFIIDELVVKEEN